MTLRRPRALPALLVATGLACASLAIGVVPGGAATAPVRPMLVRRVDARNPAAVKVDVASGDSAADPASFTVREGNAAPVRTPAATFLTAGVPTATVLVVDTSVAMAGLKMRTVQAGLKQLITAKAPNSQIAVVAYGGAPRVVQDLSADTATLLAAVDRLTVAGGQSLYSGTRIGANLLMNQPDLLPQLVIVGGGPDLGSSTTATDATADILASKALTYTIGLKFDNVDLSVLASFAGSGRGAYEEATDVASATKAFATVVTALEHQYELTFAPRAKVAEQFTIAATGLGAQAQLIPGGVADGPATNPTAVVLRQAPPLLRGKAGLLLIAFLVLIAGALAAYAIAELTVKDSSTLEAALAHYEEGAAVADDDGQSSSLISSALMQRAVATTARLANDRGFLDVVEGKLEQADLALRPAEALFFYLVAIVVLGAVGGALGGLMLGLIALGAAVLLPPAILNFMAGQRLRKFNSQLPDMLQLLASSLRAGFSFLQGVEAVAREVGDPMGSELRRVIVEAQLGRPVEEALEDCAQRMGSPDFDWAVMAVGIQREVGGNLAELLQTVSTTMVERERLRRDVKSLTAEGRVSAIVLAIMPPALGLVFYVTNPAYISVLFNQTVGQVFLGLAIVSMMVGFFWMKKVIEIKV